MSLNDKTNFPGKALLAVALFLVAFAQSTLAMQKQEGIIPTESHQRVALVIGNGKYTTDSLKNPENDAQEMAKTLAGLGFEVDYFTNLNQQEMIRHIFDFYHHKAAKSPLRVVYYAGHGIQYEGRNYLIPVDANLELPAAIPQTSFMLDELRRGLDVLQEGASVVILDTCRVSVCPVKPCRGIMSSLGLSNERKSRGTLIAYSTGPGRPANDGGQTEHSLYTQILIELLEIPGIPVEKLFRRLTEAVFQRSGGQQKPEFVDGLMGGEICIKSGLLGECPSHGEVLKLVN